MRSSTAATSWKRLGSSPVVCRRGGPSVGATSDWTSRNLRRCPVPQGLDRVDREEERTARPRRLDDVAELTPRHELQLFGGTADPPRACRDLLERLLAGRIEAGEPGHRQVHHQLEEKGRLADAGLTRHEGHGTGKDPAAEHAIDAVEPGRHPGRERAWTG